MKKLSFIMMVAATMGLTFSSCKKREDDEVRPSTVQNQSIGIQSSTVAYTIKTNEFEVDGSKLHIAPGSTVIIQSGTRGPLYLKNFNGTEGNPITFINGSGGPTIIKGDAGGPWAVKVGYCKHIRITGTGGSTKYGIVSDGGHNGFVLPELSTNFEVDHVEIKNAGFAGMMAKTDPVCDKSTWRANFTMRSVSIHDNYVHDVSGEGFYIGNSFWNGRQESCGTVYPHAIEGLRVYNNITKNTGCEGIQVGCAQKDCEIYNNSIENPGRSPFANFQNNGLQVGAGTSGKCYNNIIKNAPGNGLVMNGIGGNLVYNNLILNSGALGVFCDERTEPGQGFTFVNNTIVNCGSDAFKLYSEQVPYNNIINNIVVNPKTGKFINANPGVKVTDKNNYFTMDVNAVKFAAAGSVNYTLTSGSPAVNAGTNTASFGVTNDYAGNSRPYGGAYDIGAYEFMGKATNPAPPTTTAPKPTTPTTPTSPTKPTTPATPATGLKVGNFTLINADTDKDITTLREGSVIDLKIMGTKNISVRANPIGTPKSVVFSLNNRVYRVENGGTFSIGGDSGKDYWPWRPLPGNYTLTATPYSEADGKGKMGTPLNYHITVK